MGIHTIQWDVDSLDWKEIPADEIYSRVTSKVQSGSIVLFHNAAIHTPEALPSIIEYLQGEGYSIVPVSELILKGDYTIDHTGRQIPAGQN
jgi:peptidoglycan/xylan/chitin deacetylase (PgdA/CDA1 family)